MCYGCEIYTSSTAKKVTNTFKVFFTFGSKKSEMHDNFLENLQNIVNYNNILNKNRITVYHYSIVVGYHMDRSLYCM